MARKIWTPEEVDFLKRVYATTTAREIADVLGRNRQSVWDKANDLGLKRKKPTQITEKDVITPEKQKVLDEIKRVKDARNRTAKEYYTCTSECGETKLGKYFTFRSTDLKRDTRCTDCKVKENRRSRTKRIIEGREW